MKNLSNDKGHCDSAVSFSSFIHLDELDEKMFIRNRAAIYKRDLKKKFSKCMYCGEKDGITIDHFIPKSKGGWDDESNWVTACPGCNGKKGSADAYDWFTEQSFFSKDRWNTMVALLEGEILINEFGESDFFFEEMGE